MVAPFVSRLCLALHRSPSFCALAVTSPPSLLYKFIHCDHPRAFEGAQTPHFPSPVLVYRRGPSLLTPPSDTLFPHRQPPRQDPSRQMVHGALEQRTHQGRQGTHTQHLLAPPRGDQLCLVQEPYDCLSQVVIFYHLKPNPPRLERFFAFKYALSPYSLYPRLLALSCSNFLIIPCL